MALDMLAAHSRCKFLDPPYPKGSIVDLDLVTVAAMSVLITTLKKPDLNNFSFVTRCVILLEAIAQLVLWGPENIQRIALIKGGTYSARMPS